MKNKKPNTTNDFHVINEKDEFIRWESDRHFRDTGFMKPHKDFIQFIKETEGKSNNIEDKKN